MGEIAQLFGDDFFRTLTQLGQQKKAEKRRADREQSLRFISRVLSNPKATQAEKQEAFVKAAEAGVNLSPKIFAPKPDISMLPELSQKGIAAGLTTPEKEWNIYAKQKRQLTEKEAGEYAKIAGLVHPDTGKPLTGEEYLVGLQLGERARGEFFVQALQNEDPETAMMVDIARKADEGYQFEDLPGEQRFFLLDNLKTIEKIDEFFLIPRGDRAKALIEGRKEINKALKRFIGDQFGVGSEKQLMDDWQSGALEKDDPAAAAFLDKHFDKANRTIKFGAVVDVGTEQLEIEREVNSRIKGEIPESLVTYIRELSEVYGVVNRAQFDAYVQEARDDAQRLGLPLKFSDSWIEMIRKYLKP